LAIASWAALGGAAVLADPAPTAALLPAHFEGDTIYVQLRTPEGAPLQLYTDTGGGGLILSAEAARRLGLHVALATDPEVTSHLGPETRTATPPRTKEPSPPLPAPAVIVDRVAEIPAWPGQGDGIVGAPWFAGHVWTWNYPKQTLGLEPASWRPPRSAHVLPLGFQTDAKGRETTHFPRLEARIDGRKMSFLLDTGAETYLTPAAVQALGRGQARMRATSMISSSIFESWRAAHPDWPVIRAAQVATGADMIRVAHILIAGIDVGPVWFTRRPDAAYETFMSSMTDQPVVGSLGGNAFRSLIMTVDYPNRRVSFLSP
jgi:hypothetical protein